MADSQAFRNTVEQYMACWKTNDRATWLSLFADDACVTDPVGTPAHVGKEAIGAFWDRVHQMPMTFEPEVHKLVSCGQDIMASFSMKSIGPGGMGMQVDIVDIFEFNEKAEIRSIKAYWDATCTRPLKGE